MRGDFAGRRVVLRATLAGVPAVAIVLLALGRGGLRADERAGDRPETRQGVSEAKVLVKVLEARLHAAEADLQKARELLASVEGGPPPAPSAPVETKKIEEAVPDSKALPEDDRALLEGVWRIAGVEGHRGGEFRKPPYDEYKIMTAGHYLWLSFDPETGKVLRSGGGTYGLKDGIYTARVDYSNADDLRAVVGREYHGTCRLEGKQWYHFGTMTNGAGFDELWERVH